ncbi:pentapeptide repeat-containing protein [Priestia koreensis]
MFSGADFTGANLENKVWRGAMIDGAIFDGRVKDKIQSLL